jgi:hypothetical protein
VRYEISDAPLDLYVCHCLECRKQSASAFGISLTVRRAGLRVIQGQTKSWTRPTDSGGRRKCIFCTECGSRLWHEAEPPTEMLALKGGSLDRPLDLRDAIHLWTTRKLPGVIIPEGVVQFPGEPD